MTLVDTDFPRTSSRLWAEAFAVAPVGTPWSGPTTACVMCGAPVSLGDPSQSANGNIFNESFNNKIDVRFDGKAVCGHCLALWDKKWMQNNSKAYAVAGQGVFMLSKNLDIASFVLQPPDVPYVAVFNTRQQAHMIWRTPVAMPSKTHLQVRIDDELMVIDVLRVRQAVRAWQDACRILIEVGRPKQQPFLLSYNLASVLAGIPHRINASAVQAHSPQGRDCIRVLRSLTMGEFWALSAARDIDLDHPATWPPRTPVPPKV